MIPSFPWSTVLPPVIPGQLIGAGFRFIIVRALGKEPLETRFPDDRNYAADDPFLVKWISPKSLEGMDEGFWTKNGRGKGWFSNYGVLCSARCIAIDLDGPEIIAHALKLPEIRGTFQVRSGSGEGLHAYLTTDGGRTVALYDPEKKDENVRPLNVGHIKSARSFVVGPNSIHPSGKPYTVVNPAGVRFLPFREILEHFREFIAVTPAGISRGPRPVATRRAGPGWDSIPLESIVNVAGMRSIGGQLIGSHPYHGSEGGRNFTIDAVKNRWHCYRCDSTGGPLQIGAMHAGVAECGAFQRGCNPLRKSEAFKAAVIGLHDLGVPENTIRAILGKRLK